MDYGLFGVRFLFLDIKREPLLHMMISHLFCNGPAFSQSPPEGSEGMDPNDFQKLMNTARQSDHQMTQDEFNQLFEALKQGKSAEEVARMEQMVQLARSFMK